MNRSARLVRAIGGRPNKVWNATCQLTDIDPFKPLNDVFQLVCEELDNAVELRQIESATIPDPLRCTRRVVASKVRVCGDGAPAQ